MSYRSEKRAKEILKINEVMEDMPEFVAEWVQNLRYKKTTSTILNYLYVIKSFLTWVGKDVTLEDLENLKVDDFYQYLDCSHVMIVNKGGKPSLASKKRKLASIRSLYHFLFKTEKIATNRASLIDLPEIQDRSSITLDPAETADLLDNVKYGNHLTPRQQKKHNKYVKRDLAHQMIFFTQAYFRILSNNHAHTLCTAYGSLHIPLLEEKSNLLQSEHNYAPSNTFDPGCKLLRR